jgi:hypothetical protein
MLVGRVRVVNDKVIAIVFRDQPPNVLVFTVEMFREIARADTSQKRPVRRIQNRLIRRRKGQLGTSLETQSLFK